MRAKKTIVTIFNVLFMVLSLGIIAIGVIYLIDFFTNNNIASNEFGKFINSTCSAIFTPILLTIQYLFKGMKMPNQVSISIATGIPVGLCFFITLTGLILMIKTLKNKNCKVSSLLNILLSLLNALVVMVCIIVLIYSKQVNQLESFLQSSWLLLLTGMFSFVLVGVNLVPFLTSGYQNKSNMVSQEQLQNIYTTNSAITEPQLNQQFAQSQPTPTQQTYTQSQPMPTQQAYTQSQSTPTQQAYTQSQSMPTQQAYTQPQPTQFTSPTSQQFDPFEAKPSATNNAFSNPANSYTASSNYSNPASSYTATSSSYTNPASAYSATSSSYTNPASAYSTTSSSYTNPASTYGQTTTGSTQPSPFQPTPATPPTQPTPPQTGANTDPNNQ